MTDRQTNNRSATDRDAALRAKLPSQEQDQPDPLLQMSTGRIGAGALAMFVVAVVVILSIVLYGLNVSYPGNQPAPPAPSSSPAAGNSGAATPIAPQSTNRAAG